MQSSKELTRELSDPNFNALNETSSVITSIQSIPAISSEENQSQITSTLVNKKCSQICEQRPIHFDYQAHIKKIVLSIKGDTKHYDGLEVSEALMQMPFITFDTAVVKVSDFISFAKKNAVEVNNLAELKGKSIQVMHGESEIMVIKISGKKDSLIWWGNDDNHQTGLQISTTNRNPFCLNNEKFSFDVVGSIKIKNMQVSVASNLESFMNSDNKLDHDSYKEEINQSKKLEDVDQINTDSINNSAVYFRKHEKKEVPQDIENSLAEFKVALPAPGFFSKPVKGKRSFKPDKLEEKDAKRPKYIHVECQNSTTSVNENVKFSKK